jgi:hypothetical protein
MEEPAGPIPDHGSATPPMRGPEFLPSVLQHPEFGRNGILFGTERVGRAPIRWVVIDPGRHSMEVWRKSGRSLTDSARLLGASVITNGPFSNYGSGHLLGASARLIGDVAGPAFHHRGAARQGTPVGTEPAGLRARWEAANVFHYQATAPLGFVVGNASGISETSVPRPRLHYFGRWEGCAFEDYEIAQGDPYGPTEAVGGLFRGVMDYQPFLLNRFMRIGFWGLAPLPGDRILEGAGVESALEAYARRGHACRGVIVFAAGWANTRRLTQRLASIRVKDAVQIDGSDSLLLGRGDTLVLGALMPPWKQVLQCWGIQFRARPTAPPSLGG